MKRRKIGSLGFESSEMGFGCMGLNHHRGPVKDRNEMISVVHAAIDSGITMLDTAEVYGPYTNEEIVGDAIKGRRDKLEICTKCGFDIGDPEGGLDSRPETIRKSIEGSLKRLGTDYIDLYYVHRIDPNVPIEDVAYLMGQLKKEGKIRFWGVSEAGEETIRKAHAVEPLTAVQNEYSIWLRDVEEGLFPTLEELGIGMVAYSPLGRGYLTGKIDSNTKFTENDNRGSLPRFTKEAMKVNQVILDYMEALAKDRDATLAQIAIAWVLAQKPWIVPIPGTTRIERVHENIGALKVSFSREELVQIREDIEKMNIVGGRYAKREAERIGK